MKKTKVLVTIALVLALLCSIGAAVADYTGHAEGGVAGYDVYCNNYITADRKNCGAGTSAGNNLIAVSVSITYYYHNTQTGEDFVNGRGNGGFGGTGIGGPALGTYLHYDKIVSTHTASYENQQYNCSNLTTTVP
jgi:hypothetical protein